jgi:hypothetical protein
MYESPIEVISRQMRTQQEDHVYKAVLEVGVNVDKDELIKALKYDRDQYDKGYRDGMSELGHILSDFKKEIHDKAVYPNCHGVEPYISLKVFDAVINKLIGS